ncbi:MAG: hypothetical protein R6V85_09020 [Polyangia bacterium]
MPFDKSFSWMSISCLLAVAGGCADELKSENWCGSNEDCQPGYYCNEETALCDQDCTVDEDCPGESVCDAHGRCVDEDGDTDTEVSDTDPCGDAVLLVVDRSDSMEHENKWQELISTFDSMLTMFGGSTEFGLEVFPDDSCDADYDGTELGKVCRAPDNMTVDIGPGTAGSIKDSLYDLGNCGGTPTSGALFKAAGVVGGSGAGVQIVLVTDGLPNCNTELDGSSCECLFDPPGTCDGYPEHCLDIEAAEEAAAELLAAGSPVHVLAYDMDEDDIGIMDQIAASGGTDQARSCPDEDALGNALASIFESITEC